MAENPEKQNAARKRWRLANMDKTREYRRAGKKKYAAKNASYMRKRKMLEKLTGSGFSKEDLQARFAYFGYLCWMCGEPAECTDHVKPLSKGGPHTLANIRPACQSCNTTKGTDWPYTPPPRR